MSDDQDAVEAKRQSILEARRRASSAHVSSSGSGAHPQIKIKNDADSTGSRRALSGSSTGQVKTVAQSRDKEEKSRALPVLLGILVVIILAVGGYLGVSAYRSSTPEGRVRAKLLAAEFCLPEERAKRMDEVDSADPNAVKLVIGMLGDAEKADDGKSHSIRTVREVANDYLLHVARKQNRPAPQVAVDIQTALAAGKTPTGEQWAQLPAAWQGWAK